MKKILMKIISLMLALIMIFSMLSVAVSATEIKGSCGNGVGWTFDDETGTLTIIGSGSMTDYYYDAKPEYYTYRNEVTRVIIQSGVTSVGASSFEYFYYLESVDLSNSVYEIGSRAFEGCSRLKEVKNCNSVYKIGYYAFYCCTRLEKFDNSNGASINITKYAFSCCTSLKEFKFSKCTDTIEEYAFEKCRSLTSITFGSSLRKIDNYAFTGCSSAESIVFPEGIETFGRGSFSYCSSLKEVNIPASLKSATNNPFSSCNSLVSIKVDENNTIFDSRNDCNTIIITASDTLLSACKNTEIPQDVVRIGDSAFYGCLGFTELVLPASIKYIYDYAFGFCENLETIVLPEGLKQINRGAFSGCHNLKNFNLPDTVTTIGVRAFESCYKLTTVEIPESVLELGDFAFNYCTSLTRFKFNNTITKIGYHLFEECRSLKEVVINSVIDTVVECAFKNCGKLTIYCPGDESIKENIEFDPYYNNSYIEANWVFNYPGHTHTFTKQIIKKPTCAQYGISTYTCEDCGFSYCEAIEKSEHHLTHYSVPKIGTSYGEEYDYCLICYKKFNSEIVCYNPTKISDFSVGDTFNYGKYPQSKVTDEGIIEILDSYNKDWISYNYYSGTGTWDDGNMTPSDYMKYCDLSYDGNTYRAVMFTQYRPYRSGLTTTADNSYQDLFGYYTNTIYYFKFEPIVWRVLDPDDGLIICNSIIDSQPFQNTIYHYDNRNLSSYDDYYTDKTMTSFPSNWSTSSLRSWLNDDFYNFAFTEPEKTQIASSRNTTSSKKSSSFNSKITCDKIFILSSEEAVNSKYGFSSYNVENNNRKMKPTAYAECQGCWEASESGYKGNSYWWLRSAFYSGDLDVADYHGKLIEDETYGITADVNLNGVVPALRMNPNAVISIYNEHECNYVGKVTTEPTCTHVGEMTYTCTICGDTYTSIIEKTEHNLTHNSVSMTCIQDGCEYDYCSTCKQKFNMVTYKATGHNFVDGVCTICNEGRQWEYTETNEGLIITKYVGSEKNVTVPSQILGKSVIKIGTSAFENNSIVEYVSIPDSVTEIEEKAFRGCTALKEIFVGNGLKIIGDNAFENCSKLSVVCITSESAKFENAFSNNDARLKLFVPTDSSTEDSARGENLKLSTYIISKKRENKNTISFSGSVTLYQELDYHFMTELVKKNSDVCYLYFNKIIFEGIYNDIVTIGLDGHVDEGMKYLTLEKIYIGAKINGKTISFSDLVDYLNSGENITRIFFVDEDEKETTFSDKVDEFFLEILNVVSRAINRIVKVFKKK